VARTKRLARWKNTESGSVAEIICDPGEQATGQWDITHREYTPFVLFVAEVSASVLETYCEYSRAIEGSDSWDDTNEGIVSAPNPRAQSHCRMIQGTLKDLPPQAAKKLSHVVTTSGK
jgi:hypothetical protein